MRAAILIALLVAIGPAAAQDWPRYRVAAASMSLSAPADWRAVPPVSPHIALLLRPPERHPAGPADCSVSHRSVPALQALTQSQVDAAAATTPMSEAEARESLGADGPGATIRDRRIIRAAGLPAQSFVFEAEFDVPGGRVGAVGRVVLLHRPAGFVGLNCTVLGLDLPAARRSFTARQDEIAGIIDSLAFD